MPTGIYKRIKPNKGQFQKGEEPRNGGARGKHWKLSEEAKKKHSEALMGKKLSEEHRKNLSLAHKGKDNNQLGRHHSEETKRKIRENHLNSEVFQKAIKNPERIKKISEALRGEKSYLWEGGITPLINQIRNCFEYRQWRSDIFTRDGYICQLCGQRGNKLHADHYPKSFSEIFDGNKPKTLEEALNCEEFWDINNGRTLCFNCHKKTENYLKKYNYGS